MKIDMTKKYTISGVGLAMLCQLIPAKKIDEQERILHDCVRILNLENCHDCFIGGLCKAESGSKECLEAIVERHRTLQHTL